jgi:peptidoglycan/LPS O-acetylase OafA/YrhL
MLLDRLRRITRDGKWIPEIDGLRFLAISSVLLFHMGSEIGRAGLPLRPDISAVWVNRIFINGDRGVRLFFVISGLILALPFARHFLLNAKAVSLKNYYLRRLTRLEPPYIVSVLFAVFLIGVHNRGFAPGFAGHALATLFYQHNLIYGSISSVNLVTWSLEVEVQFYLLAPLLMQLYRIERTHLRRGLMLLIVLALGLAQAHFAPWPRVQLSILFYLQYFLAGLFVADIFVLDLAQMRSSLAWDAAGILALAAMYLADRDAYWPHVVLPILMATICLSAMRSIGLRRVLGNQWIAVIGGMCYSIYLLHFLLMAALFKVTRHALSPALNLSANNSIQFFILLLPVVALCAVFYVLIERPCMDPNWPSKLWVKLTGRRQSEAALLDSAQVTD